jgi:hypothetical protein|tara:strand:+ start:175 stop:345 length:171 start_codon:yes stop_codon:yes gene_type:complete
LSLLATGGDPSELMRKKGIIGNQNIVTKVVQVEDKEKMREFEEKLEREKQEIKLKA